MTQENDNVHQLDMGFGAEPKLVEDKDDIPNDDLTIEPEQVLTDDDLATSGIVPVKAYMRSAKSKHALRQKKHKEKAEQGSADKAPRKQLNVVAPVDDDAREALKDISAQMLEGEITVHEARVFASNRDYREQLDLGVKAAAVMNAGGLRGFFIRRWLK